MDRTCRCALALLAAMSLFVSFAESKTNGQWGTWSDWSGWASGLCAGDQRVRTRPCTNPVPSSDGEYCPGDNSENQAGPVHGGWSKWSQWSTCERPCGGSTVKRTRACDNPAPKNNGRQCQGIKEETKLECLQHCPDGRTDGQWSLWGDWSPCPSKCSTNGGATITRHRSCNLPPPANGGKPCLGSELESIIACFKSCPRDGGFGAWSAWSKCSLTCGHGIQVKQRFCNNPEPANGQNCTGDFTMTKPCIVNDCYGAVDGQWSAWSEWSPCSESTICFKGKSKRTRTCSNPAPSKGGRNCIGLTEEIMLCPKSGCTDLTPTSAPKVAIDKNEYIARECGVLEKFAANGAYGSKVPAAVYTHLAFKQNNFKTGYFNLRTEESGKIIKFCFEPVPPLTIKEAADKVPSYRKAALLPKFSRPTDESQPILGFSIRVKNESSYGLKGYDFGITVVDEYVPGVQLFTHNVMFTYYSEGSYWGFLAKGEYRRFLPSVFDSVVYHNYTDNLAYFTGQTKKMRFIGFLHVIGMTEESTPSWIKSAFKAIGLWDFEFGPVEVAYDFREPWMAPYRFTATFHLGGIPVHFEVQFIAHYGNIKIAFGISFDGESYAALMSKLSGISSGVGGFLEAIGLQLEIGVAYCPSITGEFDTTLHTRFLKEPLRDFVRRSVPEGLSVVAQISLPKDCKSSSFCKICKMILGPLARFRIAATVRKDYYKITAGFYKIHIVNNIYFWRCDMWIEVNLNNSVKVKSVVGFRVEIKFPVDGDIVVDGMKMISEIIVGGVIKHELGTPNIEGVLYMNGMWRKAFGLSWLNIGNILIGVTLVIGAPPTGFQLGGQLEFGENCLYAADFANDGNCLRVKVYFGIGKPSYFYGQISALTVKKLMRMFGAKVSLPKPVEESGFPKGAMVSYCQEEKQIDLRDAGGPIVRVGMRFKGILNLLGYELNAEVRYSKTEIYIYGEIDPIFLGNIVKVTRNKTATSLGPIFNFHYRAPPKIVRIPLPYFKIYFSGYAKVFGIEAFCFVNITMQATEIYIYGKVWNLIYAELYISAGYNFLDIKDMHFYVRLIVDLRGLADAIEKARKAVDEAFKKAQEHIRGAIDDVKRAKDKCKEAMRLKCDRCMSLKCKEAEDNCKGFLDAAGKWIGGVLNAAGKWIVDTGKKILNGLAKVGNAIKKVFSGWRRRRAIASRTNDLFEEHIRPRRFISKLICEGLVGGGCRGVSHLCYGACKGVEHIGQGLCNILDVAVGILKAAEAVSGWISAAIQFLLQMFILHGIRFELGLGHKFGGGFMVAADIDITLFGNRMFFGFAFDLNNPVKSIFNAKDSGLYRYKEGVKQARTGSIYDAYDKPNPFSDFDLSSHFGIEASQTGGSVRLGGCLAALTKNEGDQLKLIGCNGKDARQQWTFTLKGLLINKHSSKCLDLSGTHGTAVTQKTCNDGTDNQHVECSIVARTMKRRRSAFCIQTAKSSPNGPGTVYHRGSNKCLYVAPAKNLVLKGTCNTKSTEFNLNSKGHLIHTESGGCVVPQGGAAKAGVQLVIAGQGCQEFAFTKEGSLQHKTSRLCLQTAKREMDPHEFTPLILGTLCEKASSTSKDPLPDLQMLFSFVPTDNLVKLGDCTLDDYLKLDKRFEVAGDQLATICSKYNKDLAMHKTATQSSTDLNGFASRGVDGNFKFHWSDRTCTLTRRENNPWWKVDLGKEYIVTDITVINRGEYADRFKNVEVRVGNLQQHVKNPICHDRVASAFAGEAVRLQCNPPIPGQYVSVSIVGEGVLTVCEVIVNSRVGGISDWCLLDNGGCDQICYNKCGRGTSCGCYSGFDLASDGKRCIDINECLTNNGGCRADKGASCVNFPGSYYCSCRPGFILADNNEKECVDFNECGVKNGGCEQLCNNTSGGYNCECRAGYGRKPNDPYGCQDINECNTDNGGCSHYCTNYEGGYYCRCKPGYRLQPNGKECEEIYCPVLKQLPYIEVTPSNVCINEFANIKIGTSCVFTCKTGYEMPKEELKDSITCQVDGSWNKATPSCTAVECSAVSMPVNGGVIPADCHTGSRQYGQRCVHYCNHGYRLRGPSTKYCQANKQWSSNADVRCEVALLPPYINCPTDIVVNLPPDKSSMALGTQFRSPQTNMKIYESKPDKVGPNYVFQAGVTEVAYYALSDDKQVEGSCTHLVELQDVTKPVITNCPDDIVTTTNAENIIISWIEPTFSDNVAIKIITKPKKKPGEIFAGGESVTLQYSAIDTSGNEAYCNFKVTIKRGKCPPLLVGNGVSMYPIAPNLQYSISCGFGLAKTLIGGFGSYATVYCKDGQYEIKSVPIGLKVPGCVSYTASTQTASCTPGSVKATVTDFFGGTSYTCENCPFGKYHDAKTEKCQPCAVGLYQSKEGQTQCEPCPKFTATATTGSTAQSHCIAQCAPGSFSVSGLNLQYSGCEQCPMGTYSSLYGSKTCSPCPSGSSTTNLGSKAETDCGAPAKIIRLVPETKLNIKADGDGAVECLYTGIPVPNAEWKRADSKPLPQRFYQEPIYDLSFKKIGSSLHVKGAIIEDAGQYICEIKNRLSSDSKTIEFVVQ